MGRDDAPFRGRRVLVVAAYDSFLRAAAFFGRRLEQRGAQVDYVLAKAGVHQLSVPQARACGLESVPPSAPLETIASSTWLDGRDLVLLALDGARTRRFTVALGRMFGWGSRGKRPLTVSFYPGLLFRLHLEGMFSRMSADLLLLNSPYDHELYRSMLDALGLGYDNSVMAGLSTIPAQREVARPLPTKGSILFVGQPTVPGWRHERLYLLNQLADVAGRHPDTPVVYKPRHRKNETTLHTERHHAEDLLEELRRMRAVPRNLQLSYGGMRELLGQARVCLTVSSTAALEALAMGIPTRIITDFGVHEQLGTHFFLGSGMFSRLDDVHPDLPLVVDPAWYARHVASAEECWPEIEARLLERLAHRDGAATMPFPNGRLFGRPQAYDEFVRSRFGEGHLSLLGESQQRAHLERARAVAKRFLSALRTRA